MRAEAAVDQAQVPADGENGGQAGERGVDAVVGHGVDMLGPVADGPGERLCLAVVQQPFGHGFGEHALCRPAHADIAFDGAPVGRQGDGMLFGFVVRDRGVHIGGGAADVDHEHGLVGQQGGQPADTGQHGIGRDGTDEPAESRPAREALAADHVLQEHGANRGPRRGGGQFADVGQHVVGHDDGPAGGEQEGQGFLADGRVPGQHDRTGDPVDGKPVGVVQEDAGVAAVGAAGEQEDVRFRRAQGTQAGAVQFAGGHVHDLGPRRQRDPVAGFHADQPLLPDDGQP